MLLKMNSYYSKPPKLLPTEYASFRKDVIEYLVTKITIGSKLLDPMAGTAPLLPFAESRGIEAHFNDLLPVHFIINSAKKINVFNSLVKREKHEKEFLKNKITKLLQPLEGKEFKISENWIDQETIDAMRLSWKNSSRYSQDIHILLQAALILSARYFGSFTTTRNNTWIKKGGMATGECVDSIADIVTNKIKEYFKQVYNSQAPTNNQTESRCHLYNCEINKIPLIKNKYIIITSPSFANRYDYIQAYYPELFFLYHVINSPHPSDLKEKILATNNVKGYEVNEQKLSFIKKCSRSVFAFLSNVKEKEPKSKTRSENEYYFRYFVRYYYNLFECLDKLDQHISSGSEYYMVVQNNIHRGEINEMDYI